MKKLFSTFFIVFAAVVSTVAQNAEVTRRLGAKYSMVQYHPECGGWYFLSYQKGPETLYGVADASGNVLVSEALKFKLHKGYGEFYLLDMQQQALHNQWKLEYKQYERDLNKYNKVEADYKATIAAYNAKVEVAKEEAKRRWQYARQVAIKNAEAEAARQRAAQGSNTSILGAVLSGVAGGLNIAAAANSVKYQPFESQVLAERNLTVAPSKPYNPLPQKPAEPADGYYWKKMPFRQGVHYSYVDYDKLNGTNGFADVMRDGRYGLVDVYFKEVVPCTNSSKVLRQVYSSDRQDRYIICNNGKYGVLDNAARYLVPAMYSGIEVSGSRLLVERDRRKGMLNLNGKEIMPCQFEQIKNSNGYFLCKKDKVWGIYTGDAKELYPCQFQNVNFSSICGKKILNTQLRGLWGVVDFSTGNNVLPNNYVNVSVKKMGAEEFFEVKDQKGKIGLYDNRGIVLLPCEFTDVKTVSLMNDNYLETHDAASKVGLYTMTGIPTIPGGKYTSYELADDFFLVKDGNLFGVCGLYGDELIPCRYEGLKYDKDNKIFIAREGDTFQPLTLYGHPIFFPVKATGMSYNGGKYFRVASDKGYGAVDFNGNLIVPMKSKIKDLPKKVLAASKKVNLDKPREKGLKAARDEYNAYKYTVAEEEAHRKKFSFYAQNYVERVVNEWQKRGEFEKMSNYQTRVNSDTRQQKVYELTMQAQKNYIREFKSKLPSDNMAIVGNYDPDNETYRIRTSFSDEDILVNVPSEDAQEFKASFASLSKTPEFFVEKDGLGLAEYSFTMPNGHTFRYNNRNSLTHMVAAVEYAFDPIEIDGAASNMNYQRGKQRIATNTFDYGRSDVDVKIPQAASQKENVYAVIIANENYENEKKVDFAYNDGYTVKEYFSKAFGIPDKNIHFRANASLNNMRFELNWMKQIAQETAGDAEFIFYYAGHGMPNDAQSDACLLPVDGNSGDFKSGYALSELYASLSDMPSKNTLVMLDACFSGSQRSGEVMSSTRGVALSPRIQAPKGNMVVFSAASKNETAHPFKEKYHGMFTYFFLKRIQEVGNNVSLGELTDYVKSNVAKTALTEVSKPQHPIVTPSSALTNTWRQLKFN